MSRNSKRNRRQSKPKAQQPQQTAPATELVVEEPVTYERTEPFADVEDYESGLADERQLRLLMKDWRKGRATRTIWDMITDGYVMIFSLVIILAMIISGIMSIQQSAAGCSTSGCLTSRGLLPWLVLALLIVVGVSVSRIFGPVIASAAEGFWLLDAPVRRSRLLNRRLWGVVIGAGVIGAILGGAITMVTGLSWASIATWAAAIGCATAAVVALAAIEQAAERTTVLAIVQTVVGLVATVVLVAMISVASELLVLPIDPRHTEEFGIVVLAAAAVCVVVFSVVARRKLHNVRRTRLVSGGDLLSGMQGAMFALDFGLMRDIVVNRRWLTKGHVQPSKGRASGRATLVWREVDRVLHNPRAVLVLLVSAVVPYALLSMGLGNLTPVITAVVLLFVMVPFFDSLRVLSRTKGLARCFPMSTSQLNGALTTVPAVLALIWGLAAGPAFVLIGDQDATLAGLGTGLMKGLITAAAGYIAAIRWVSAKSADYSSPMVATGFGALPPGLMFNLLRGFDVIALITLPLLFNWSPWISVIIAVICYQVLRSGGINTQDLMEQNAEAQRELAAAKGGASGSKEKISYTRTPRR
ncbi:DUF6297 family protein [Propionimicrobium sp. PCR01-08-3]|uniref:DUF6297 family protein n=1 Tax=Propionimicrobium sp. PCR01-08-3 TaxID=3052086 RepID=UPI00255CE4B0|nr:DUF6297 family protein [Propionimicrobium sp. PCR01-08-3]WIY83117.1 DUF6297 family protein [Propionimicrobium sp. PCR01-08-3]